MIVQTGLAAYGPLANEFANCFTPSDPVVVFDHLGIADALRDCAERKFKNERFFVRAIIQRENAARADFVIPSIVASFQSVDERRAALEQAFLGSLHANGQPLQNVAVYNPAAIRLMQAAIRMSDGLAVTSEAERRRVHDLLKADPPAVKFTARSRTVPTVNYEHKRSFKDAVVIWAPHLAGNVALSFVIALSDLHLPLLLVSKTKPADTEAADWIMPESAGTALTRAKLIVDTTGVCADSAVSLSSYGVPLVLDVESGAQELLENARVYDRGRMGSIFEAVVSALGGAPTHPRIHAVKPKIEMRESGLMTDGPLATIVIPTLDRPILLRYALDSCQRQIYKNIETIVVVDGGPRLDDLAMEFPDVRFLHMAENNPVVSTNTAYAAATGKYVTLLSDDDLFFPDHVAALVTALERSGAAVAHSDVLTAFLRGDDSKWQLYGFESNMSEAADLTSFLITNKIGATAVMVRKSDLGDEPFDASIPLYRDYELWLRLLSKHDFVHVERITSCYTTRNQGSGQQSTMWLNQAADAYRTIYERYPVAGRPTIEQRRTHMVHVASQGSAGPGMQPAGEIHPVQWPLF